MKIFVAVVVLVEDYRKEVDAAIACTRIHKTKKDAKISIMTAILKAYPSVAMDFPLKFEHVLGCLTEGRKIRLRRYLESQEIVEWVEEDVPEDEDEFKAFEKTELKFLEESKEKLVKFIKSGKDQPFEDIDDDFKIPELPRGKYVRRPIVYRIEEQEIEIDAEATTESKKRAKNE